MNAAIEFAPPVRVLIAEDEPEIRQYLKIALRRPNCTIDFAENGQELLALLNEAAIPPDLVILDVTMPLRDGLSTLREIRQRQPALPVLMLSGTSASGHMIEAMQSGANGFLTKPILQDALRNAVDRVLETAAGHHLV